jgi:succinate dehydrogenase/fumarate reductase flavoprotein subunit
MGGVRIDAAGWTGVPGLYAGGEAAGGAHGASRIAGNGGSDALVFGALAGQAAAVRARSSLRRLAPRQALEEATVLLASLLGGAGRVDAREIIAAVRHAMSLHAGLQRDGDGLTSAASKLAALEDALDSDSVVADVPLSAGLAMASARNMVLGARMVVETSLARTESRGGHQRLDFPSRDDANWLRHLVCRADASRGFVVESAPVN